MIIHYENFDNHQLTVALEVMDRNWDVVMRGVPDPSKCETCGHSNRGQHTDFTSEYVFERARCREELLRRVQEYDSFERACDVWAIEESRRQAKFDAAKMARRLKDWGPDAPR